MQYTLDEVCKLRGSGQLIAAYHHNGADDFRLKLTFKQGGKKFLSNKQWRTKTALMHTWQHNRHSIYQNVTFKEV